ncbi:hypothetical protein BDV95DRAFT_90934 [Massariosphaeria phaeospora]|uniref:Uncharacterized protein n=1 Tax=Massariosphaeria phaeospora TaxID=100035 RepID=A0A7C8I3H2_9PLEO|nr:hypothetical protein BDV95DRAFT_90934 [Massariosphaeria phaeospora]
MKETLLAIPKLYLALLIYVFCFARYNAHPPPASLVSYFFCFLHPSPFSCPRPRACQGPHSLAIAVSAPDGTAAVCNAQCVTFRITAARTTPEKQVCAPPGTASSATPAVDMKLALFCRLEFRRNE